MEETDGSTSEVRIQFKSIRKRPQRRRSRGESDEEGEVEFNKEKYEETRELQKLRYLHKYGVTAVDVIKGTESRNGD
jgi:hypothetical protein